MEAMEKFVHEQNVARYRQHLAGNGLADETDEVIRKTLLQLLAEEERKLAKIVKSKFAAARTINAQRMSLGMQYPSEP